MSGDDRNAEDQDPIDKKDDDATDAPRFWETKRLHDMTMEEWESLCDACGQCCTLGVEVEGPDGRSTSIFSDVACHMLNTESCLCKDYTRRLEVEPRCMVFTPWSAVRNPALMPESCGYRRLAEGRPLAWWHPLVSGDPETVHLAQISVRNRVVSERHYHPDELEAYVRSWAEGLAGEE